MGLPSYGQKPKQTECVAKVLGLDLLSLQTWVIQSHKGSSSEQKRALKAVGTWKQQAREALGKGQTIEQNNAIQIVLEQLILLEKQAKSSKSSSSSNLFTRSYQSIKSRTQGGLTARGSHSNSILSPKTKDALLQPLSSRQLVSQKVPQSPSLHRDQLRDSLGQDAVKAKARSGTASSQMPISIRVPGFPILNVLETSFGSPLSTSTKHRALSVSSRAESVGSGSERVRGRLNARRKMVSPERRKRTSGPSYNFPSRLIPRSKSIVETTEKGECVGSIEQTAGYETQVKSTYLQPAKYTMTQPLGKEITHLVNDTRNQAQVANTSAAVPCNSTDQHTNQAGQTLNTLPEGGASPGNSSPSSPANSLAQLDQPHDNAELQSVVQATGASAVVGGHTSPTAASEHKATISDNPKSGSREHVIPGSVTPSPPSTPARPEVIGSGSDVDDSIGEVSLPQPPVRTQHVSLSSLLNSINKYEGTHEYIRPPSPAQFQSKSSTCLEEDKVDVQHIKQTVSKSDPDTRAAQLTLDKETKPKTPPKRDTPPKNSSPAYKSKSPTQASRKAFSPKTASAMPVKTTKHTRKGSSPTATTGKSQLRANYRLAAEELLSPDTHSKAELAAAPATPSRVAPKSRIKHKLATKANKAGGTKDPGSARASPGSRMVNGDTSKLVTKEAGGVAKQPSSAGPLTRAKRAEDPEPSSTLPQPASSKAASQATRIRAKPQRPYITEGEGGDDKTVQSGYVRDSASQMHDVHAQKAQPSKVQCNQANEMKDMHHIDTAANFNDFSKLYPLSNTHDSHAQWSQNSTSPNHMHVASEALITPQSSQVFQTQLHTEVTPNSPGDAEGSGYLASGRSGSAESLRSRLKRWRAEREPDKSRHGQNRLAQQHALEYQQEQAAYNYRMGYQQCDRWADNGMASQHGQHGYMNAVHHKDMQYMERHRYAQQHGASPNWTPPGGGHPWLPPHLVQQAWAADEGVHRQQAHMGYHQYSPDTMPYQYRHEHLATQYYPNFPPNTSRGYHEHAMPAIDPMYIMGIASARESGYQPRQVQSVRRSAFSPTAEEYFTAEQKPMLHSTVGRSVRMEGQFREQGVHTGWRGDGLEGVREYSGKVRQSPKELKPGKRPQKAEKSRVRVAA